MGPTFTHYVIVRRDLPVGRLIAQVVHAAGESIVTASSSVKERRREPEVGGSSPSSRTTYGGGVAERASVVGVNPTSRAILPPNTIAVVLSVRNESRLLAAARRLDRYGCPYVLIREPDLNNEATAIGVVPCPREAVGRALKDCVLYV